MGSTTLHWVRRRAWPLALVTALLIGLGSAGWWATHPDVFDDAGGYGFRGERDSGRTMYFGIEPVTEGTRFLTGKGSPHQQLVLEVRTTRRGVVKVKGAEVSYRDGLRRGTELTGGYLTHRAR